MEDYQIQANTRQCVASGRILKTGEPYFSVLVEDQGKLVRQDYSAEAWKGPPSAAFSFWSGRVPDKESPRKLRKDDDVLLTCLERLDGVTDARQLNFRYVVALLLLRSKRLQFEDTRKDAASDFLRLRCSRTGATYEILNRRLTEDEILTVRQEVLQVVGWE